MVTVSLQFTPEEIRILAMAMSCYNQEIAHESDDNYSVFLNLHERIENTFYDIKEWAE